MLSMEILINLVHVLVCTEYDHLKTEGGGFLSDERPDGFAALIGVTVYASV